MASGFGQLRAVRHAAWLSQTPAFWARPAMPLGSHTPEWPGGPHSAAVHARLSKL
jgi:hypothetical protein